MPMVRKPVSRDLRGCYEHSTSLSISQPTSPFDKRRVLLDTKIMLNAIVKPAAGTPNCITLSLTGNSAMQLAFLGVKEFANKCFRLI